MSEWRFGSGGGHPSPTLPSQYMRKSNSVVPTSTGATTPPVQASPSSSSTNFLVVPAANGNVDNASAKKRWLRQAISEETDPLSVPSPNSRPNSPTGVECLAPLKKRRLARASMSSEVSNTPPSTPNNIDAAYSEMDADGENEIERESGENKDEESHQQGNSESTAVNRKWSCSEVSSAEEDMDDNEELGNNPNKGSDPEEKSMDEGSFCPPSKETENDTFFDKSSQNANGSTPRRSRWDQVDAPEPVNSNSNSPVKSSTDAIVLDYVRNPEQYAKLTGVNANNSSGVAELKDNNPNKEANSSEHPGSFSVDTSSKSTNSGESSAVQKPESSPKLPGQVKKKVRPVRPKNT